MIQNSFSTFILLLILQACSAGTAPRPVPSSGNNPTQSKTNPVVPSNQQKNQPISNQTGATPAKVNDDDERIVQAVPAARGNPECNLSLEFSCPMPKKTRKLNCDITVKSGALATGISAIEVQVISPDETKESKHFARVSPASKTWYLMLPTETAEETVSIDFPKTVAGDIIETKCAWEPL